MQNIFKVELPEQLASFTLLGNSLTELLGAATLFLGLWVVSYLFHRILLARLRRFAACSKTDLDDGLLEVLGAIPGWFYLLFALLVSLQTLTLPTEAAWATSAALTVLLIHRAASLLQQLIFFGLQHSLAKSEAAAEKNSMALNGLRLITRITLWSAAALLVLSNLGFEISTLLASLGIGGIAVAFALQNILGDLFSAFVIYFDRPFEIGDFIVVGDKAGVVKRIGLKTTRIQLLQGEELSISNQNLTTAEIRNFKKLKRRRVVFAFGVTYDTEPAKLAKIPETVEKIVTKSGGVFDRAHFHRFGASSLDYEVVYYAETGEYTAYMDLQQSINLEILKAFAKDKIEMAFPTQTVYLQK